MNNHFWMIVAVVIAYIVGARMPMLANKLGLA